MTQAPVELILGGQKSGKSRRAEARAAQWLAATGHEAVLIATAVAGDDEMRERIARHRAERTHRVPALATVEEPIALAQALRRHSAAHRLVIVDCLTLWLTNLLMPLSWVPVDEARLGASCEELLAALRTAAGPVVLVSNEIGLGVSPPTREARRFVDALGKLHQRIAAEAATLTWMVAGRAIDMPRAPT